MLFRSNPAVTLARTLTDTFAGIRPADAWPFIVSQVVGALLALGVFRWLLPAPGTSHSDSRTDLR